MCLLTLAVLIALDHFGVIDYRYDFKAHEWTIGLDIFFAAIGLQAMVCLSRGIEKVKYLGRVVGYLGKASLAVLLLHTLFMSVNHRLLAGITTDVWCLSLLNVAECVSVYALMHKWKYTRVLLGEG